MANNHLIVLNYGFATIIKLLVVFRKSYQITFTITIRLMSLLFGIKSSITKRFLYKVSELRTKNGLSFCIKYMKSVRLHITRYMCGNPLLVNNSRVSLIAGFPKHFLFLKEIIDLKNPIKLRGILTLLYFTRSIIPTKEEDKKIIPDYSSITNKYTGRDYSIPMYFISYWYTKNFGNNFLSIPKFDNSLHYISSKGSPFGPATISGPFALFYMIEFGQSMLTNFLKLVGESAYTQLFGNYIKELMQDHRLMTPGKVIGSLGKTSIVKDPELKRRVIAMLDYNSQLLLRPIHDDLLKLLSKLPQDRTYTQDPHNNWKPRGNRFWSLDLTAATDRFPIDLQEKVISTIYQNREFASAWRNILIDRDFSYEEGKYVKYSVGQPMGAYSSWATFTLTHHLVVAWAAKLSGLDNFNNYIILGDDIVINHDTVAQNYIAVMNKLGVEISLQKTHVSFNTYEFAKRWIRKGTEISPLPLRGILSNINKPLVVLQQLMIYLHRNNTLFTGNTLGLVSLIYNKVKIGRRYFSISSTTKSCYDFYHILRYAYGYATPYELRNYLISKGIPAYFVCSEKLIPSFMRELLILGLSKQAKAIGDETKYLFENFINQFDYENFDKKKLRYHYLTHALNNRVKALSAEVKKLLRSTDSDLIDAMVSMRVEKVEKIVSLHRDKAQSVAQLDKLWKSSINSLKLINETNYENHNISYFTTNPGLKPWVDYFLSGLNNPKEKLSLLKDGFYTNPNEVLQEFDEDLDQEW